MILKIGNNKYVRYCYLNYLNTNSRDIYSCYFQNELSQYSSLKS